MKKHLFTTEYLIMKATKADIYQCFIDMGLILPPQDIFYLFNGKIWSALMHLHHILFRTATSVYPMLLRAVANWISIDKEKLLPSQSSRQ